MIYLIISNIAFWLYCIYAWKTVGVKSSISDTYFHIKHPVLFRLFIFGVSVPLMLYSYNDNTGLLIAASLISWVGIAAGSRDHENDKIENRNHVIGATGGILAAYVSFGIEFVEWALFYKDLFFWAIVAFLISAFIIMPVGKKKGVKNHTTYIEIAAYYIIIITLMIHEAI